ncbi:AMFR-like protein, partial [Mya arenaria]
MPVILLERIPLPSLSTYTGFSLVLLSCALFYAHQMVLTAESEGIDIPVPVGDNLDPGGTEVHYMNISLPHDTYMWNMIYVMTSEAWCVWTLVNTAYCCLILLGKLVQKVVFGELRVSEQQHVRDKFWNFLFYKFIFVFGVMNVQTMEEVVLWVAWFTVLGFFHLLTQLAKDRFEYVSFSPTTPRLVHVKLLSLLCVIILSCCGLLALYCLHLVDMNLEGVWENRATYIYYTELLWGNIFLSMASLVICMQLRYLFYEFQRRIKRHKNYRKVVKNMEERFSMATPEEIASNDDDCAVCWEKMETARKLPCGHLFHNSCLRSWLEQDTSCPTCRQSLNERPTTDPNGNLPDSSRYVSWLPSFSVEVTHTNMLANTRHTHVQTSQLDNMARQVLQVFPHMPINAVMEDLRVTRSVDFTIENILEGRLIAPPPGTMLTRTALGDDDSNSDDSDNYQLSSSSQNSSTDLPSYFDIPNERGDNNSTPVEASASKLLSQFGGRFSKSTVERESMLEDRKNTMLEQAR